MAKVVFVSFYDQYSIGLRIMTPILLNAGHEAQTIFFKLPYVNIIDVPSENPISGEVFSNWELKEYAKSKMPWTAKEEDILIAELQRINPDVIGISNRSPLDRLIIPIMKKIKSDFSQKLLIAGGYGPFLNPKLYLEFLDYVVFGEAEDVIVDIVNNYDCKNNIKTLPNIIYSKNDKIVYTKIIEPEKDLGKYPIPDYDDRYYSFIEDDKHNKFDPVHKFDPEVEPFALLIGRGCVRNCGYCSAGQWKVLYKKHGKINIKPQRLRPINHIIKELKEAINKGYKYISIQESHLTGSTDYLFSFFESYKKEINLPFTAYLHPNQVVTNPNILDAAYEAGLRKCPVGIQHGCENICEKYFNRYLSNETILKFSEMLKEKKISSEYQFIAGLPFETAETLTISLDFVKSLPTKYAFFLISRLKCFPNSPLEKLFINKRITTKISTKDWYLTAILYLLRSILEDDIFGKVRELVSNFSTVEKSFSLNDIQNFYKKFSSILYYHRKILFEDSPLLLRVYKGYIDYFSSKDISVITDEDIRDKYIKIIPDFRLKKIVTLNDCLENGQHFMIPNSTYIDIENIDSFKNEILIVLSKNKKMILNQLQNKIDKSVIIP